MIDRRHAPALLLAGLLSPFLMGMGCDGPVPTRDEIVAKYPTVEAGSARPENPRVLCPFTRMLERAGLFDGDASPLVDVDTVTQASLELGCASRLCAQVGNNVSEGQGLGGLSVDIEALHASEGVSHECGLTFGFGETEVNPAVRQATIDRLAQLAGPDDRLVYADLEQVKLEICASQGVEITPAGRNETKLIFGYLGGLDNGFVTVSDVDRFLNATMPETKTDLWVDAAMVAAIR